LKKPIGSTTNLAVVCYINSTAEIKAHSDVCVTSANALKIISKLPQKNILFIPDNNLGSHIAAKLPEKNFIYHDGYCYVHHTITKEQLQQAKIKHPNAPVLLHGECQMNNRHCGLYRKHFGNYRICCKQ
jgi:quinolinate synthase